MKKKYLSILIILMTIVLSVIMIVSSNRDESDFTLVDNKVSEEKPQSEKNISSVGLNSVLEELESLSNEVKISKESSEKVVQVELKEVDKKENIVKENDSKKNNNDNKQIKEDSHESKELFKVDKEEILGTMTLDEKLEIGKLFTKLSMNDYSLILESIKNDGELECIYKIENILSKRLEKEDYNIAVDIFDKYINLSVIKK